MVQLDNFTTEQKQQYILVTTIIGLVLSTCSHFARIYARLKIIKELRKEDWCMTAGLILSYGTVVCLLLGLPNQGVPVPILGKERFKEFLLMIWIIQKLQPPTLFLIKLSFIIFHMTIFQGTTFRRISWAVAILTGCWTVANVLGTTLQCHPPSLFWDKDQTGSCLQDPVHRMGVPNAVINTLGDVIIFVMPIPPLVKLRVPRRTKIGLVGVFSLGIFVLIASFFRWIALIGSSRDAFNSSQIQTGVWTYLEMSVGITCGNLPFLAPLLGCVGPTRKSHMPALSTREEYYARNLKVDTMASGTTQNSKVSAGARGQQGQKPLPLVPGQQQKEGFTRLYDHGAYHARIGVHGRNESLRTLPSEFDMEMQAIDAMDGLERESGEKLVTTREHERGRGRGDLRGDEYP
ncbi:hypothetical protein QBC40DRAFT_319421 [Triangularia verruculosa]|uniref:Rhodopsin domain-containing protein n=1 Tax=Triangularia verruculosa TaxID=2587418 RepID=A0AAN6X5I3_9PEZI|nr:hypothetical protein QBC40DRAFT_319421 [Triangularia verruculosa]